MIVVDASLAVEALLLDGPARRLLVERQLHAPHLIDAEIASGIRGLVLGGRLPAEAGRAVLDTWAHVGLTRYPTVGLLPRMWELRDNLSAYDASYVALAEALGCPLATADARLGAAPGTRCEVTIVPR